ncbi:Ubiquitin-like domain-containing CTD phosphatase 1 [Polyplax serrata]|uniref:Ubiquitin-like domain-containing CTD phosphatase 1 n=1 Tax=Polyplax serrata TaxID=468196 RepID=A0AAN8PT93_POLSC
MEEAVKVVVKWSGKEYEITDLTQSDTVEKLKDAIFRETGVRPPRQKLLNLKHKAKPAEDSCKLSALNIKQGFKIMMMGSLEDDITQVNTIPEGMPDVINDLDIDDAEVAIENMEVHLSKIEKRIKEYEITEKSEPRAGKNLLVLDIDYTLFDHRSVAETGAELMRPYLHEFLTSAYEDYDIVIWSATSMKWIEEKMKLLGVSTHTDYKILFYLDNLAMISVHTPKYGVVNVKPLGLIWGKYPQYSSKNTIMFDDIRRNFIMNPNNGLRIRAFRQAHLNRQTDTELLKLSQYLKDISNCEDFAELDHRHWEKYCKKKREGRI